MKSSQTSSLNRHLKLWTKLAAASVLSLAIVGCGGGDGANGAPGAPGANGANGANGINAIATVQAAALTTAQWGQLSLTGQVLSATIHSPPVVTFKVTDSNGTPVTGLAQKDATGAYPNFGFALAKLKPADATTGAPSRWVSYMVVTTPATGQVAVPAFPEVEKNGTMVDNQDGTYTYTFALDVTKVKDYVDGATYDATHIKADLDDVSFEPTLPHRLLITIGGNQSGTTTAVKTSANLSYDFIPATGNAVTTSDPQRLIVDKGSCNTCHSKLSMHANFFPAIQDTKLCVVCHTEQQKYGFTDARPASGTSLTTMSYYGFNVTMRLDNRAMPNFPNMVHKIHSGENLYFSGYNQFEVKYNEVTYPQDQRNCVKCHNGAATNPDGSPNVRQTPQGDNWKNNPSRLACGACHDGINFATGGGQTLNGTYAGHVGGAKADDSLCATCHDAVSIATTYHTPVAPPNPGNTLSGDGTNAYTNVGWMTSNQSNLPVGASKISYQMGTVTVTNANAVVQFKILKDGVPVVFNPPSVPGELMSNYVGSPAIELAFALPQDNAKAPVDFNTHFDIPLKGIWNGTATGLNAGTLSATPDTNGFYTVTLTGVAIPASATMVTAGVGYLYTPVATTPPLTQINLAAYPYSAAKGGGLVVAAPVVWKVAAGYTPRRSIVDNARCNDCHFKLGVFTKEGFHAGQRNDGSNCNICHNPATGGSSGDNFWTADSRSFIHGIHGASKRGSANPFYWHASSNFDASKVTYPGVLSNCEQCHLPGTYNFASSYTKASDSAVPTSTGFSDATYANMLYPVVASGTPSSTSTSVQWFPSTSLLPRDVSYGAAPIVSNAAALTAGKVVTDGANLVNSPIAGACFSCHADSTALAHMRTNGGSIYAPRATAVATVESCIVCHAAGKVADTKVVHGVGQ